MGSTHNNDVSEESELFNEHLFNSARRAYPDWSFDRCWDWAMSEKRRLHEEAERQRINRIKQPSLWPVA